MPRCGQVGLVNSTDVSLRASRPHEQNAYLRRSPVDNHAPLSARTVEMAGQPTLPEESGRLWEQVLASVQRRLKSHQTFDTWFKPIVPRELSPELVELEVPNAFFVDWIHEHHLDTLREGLTDVLGQ